MYLLLILHKSSWNLLYLSGSLSYFLSLYLPNMNHLNIRHFHCIILQLRWCWLLRMRYLDQNRLYFPTALITILCTPVVFLLSSSFPQLTRMTPKNRAIMPNNDNIRFFMFFCLLLLNYFFFLCFKGQRLRIYF